MGHSQLNVSCVFPTTEVGTVIWKWVRNARSNFRQLNIMFMVPRIAGVY